jgi:pSer/pThr/pTyr-binding forkhead associated (FHA) protein
MPGEQAQAPAAPAMPGAPFPAAAPVPARTQSPLAGFLVTSSLDPSGQFWPVRFGRTTVGKDADNDVRLDAPGLSGKHCEIMVREQAGRMKIWLTDSNSTNGTRRNGEDIFTERPDLANHDIIGVGDVDLMLILIPFGPG